MKKQVYDIIQDLQKYQTKSALEAFKVFFDGESNDLDSVDMKEIIDVWLNRFFPESCVIQVDASDDAWKRVLEMSHEKNITLNQLVCLVLEEQIEKDMKDETHLTDEGEL